MKTSENGLRLIKEFEGCKLTAYQDIVGVWTIGYGFTKDVKPGESITMEECEIRLQREIATYEKAVHASTNGKYTQSQFDAMVSLAWNIGIKGFNQSSVLKAHIRGDYQAASRAFGLWNKAKVNGKSQSVSGLTRRRAAEAAVYLTPDSLNIIEEMPQKVEFETPMTASSINRAGVVAGGTAAVAGVSQTLDTVSNLKYSLAGLGEWLVPVLLLVTLGSVGYIIYERVMQRKNGWA